MNYGYDKEVVKPLSVGPFLAMEKTRDAKIDEAADTMPVAVFNANRLAQALHPKVQYTRVAKVVDRVDAKSFTLEPDRTRGTSALAYFRAGQYVSVSLGIGKARLSKPYTICSSPKDALGEENTSYTLTIKKSDHGYASEYILGNWTEGSEVEMAAPYGEFYYERLRDAKTVIGLAGGSGITPFLSMAGAIADGIEDFNLTILYGSRTKDAILLQEELDLAAERSGGKVKIVHVLSDENTPGYEHGFLSAKLIQKYAPDDDYSVFMCGPCAMYDFVEGEIGRLNLKKRRVRREVYGDYGDPEALDDTYPKEAAGKTYQVEVTVFGKTQTVPCRANQTLLSAMEDAGIRAPSHCRGGECGWCHSRLVSGDVFIPKQAPPCRFADAKFGWIHPCCTYPLGDVGLDVPAIR